MGQLKESRELQNPTITSAHLPASAPWHSAHPTQHTGGTLSPSLSSTQGHCSSNSPPLTPAHLPFSAGSYEQAITSPIWQNQKPSIPAFPSGYRPISLFLFTAKFLERAGYTTLRFWFLSSHSGRAFSPTHWKGAAPWGAYPWRHVAKLSGHFQSQS